MNAPAWLLAASLTFAASVHCAGMCGGFVLAAGALRSGRAARRLADHLLLQVGKAGTYAFLGALAGLAGARLLESRTFLWGERALAILAAAGLALAGLTLLGLGRARPGAFTAAVAGAWHRLVAPLLAERPAGGPLLVGMAMGLLPCPLVYAGLAAAAASGSPAAGAAILGGVALGTVPALLAVALFGAALPQRARRGLAQAAAVLLLAVAAVTLTRGLGLHEGHAAHGAGAGSSEHRCAPPTTPPAPAAR